MEKIFSVFEKGKNTLLIRVHCYDKKIYNMMLKQFSKVKQVWIREDSLLNEKERP